MAKVGRKCTITEERVSKLVQAFNAGANVQEACFYALISKESYYRRYSTDKEFRNTVESAKRYLSIAAKRNIAQKIMSGDIALAKWYLERRDPDFNGTPPSENNNNFLSNPIITRSETPREAVKKFMEKYGGRFQVMVA